MAKSGHCCSWDIWTWLELSETNGRWILLERQSKAAIFTGAGPLTIRAWTPLIWKCSCCCTASRCHSTGDVILLAEAGEEGTTQFGIDYMIAHHWDEIACEYALNEGGEIAEDNNKAQYVAISTTQKVPRGF